MVITPRGTNRTSEYALFQALVNRLFGKPTLAQGTTTTQIKSTNQVDFQVADAIARKAATDPLPTIAGLTNTGASQFCKVRVEIDVAGTVTYVQGPIGASAAQAPIPRRTAGKATLGWFDVPASFTFGTTTTNNLTFHDGDPDLGSGTIFPADRGISQEIVSAP